MNVSFNIQKQYLPTYKYGKETNNYSEKHNSIQFYYFRDTFYTCRDFYDQVLT